jgi:hypothetical protein
MCVEERGELQTESIDNLFNIIIIENFPNLMKVSHPGMGRLQNAKPSGPKEKPGTS